MGFHKKLTDVSKRGNRKNVTAYDPNLTVRLPEHLRTWMQELSAKHDVTVTAIVIAALEEAKFNVMLEEALQ